MEDKWKMINFDFASLYPNSFTMKLNFCDYRKNRRKLD